MNYSIFLAIFFVGISCAMDQEEYTSTLHERKKFDILSPDVQGPIYHPDPGFNEANQNACPICLDLIDSMESPICTLTCGHVFHFDCIDEWIKKQPTCPLSRASDQTSVQIMERRTATIHHHSE